MKYQTCLPMGIQVHPLNYDDSNVHKGHHNHDTLAALLLFAINWSFYSDSICHLWPKQSLCSQGR